MASICSVRFVVGLATLVWVPATGAQVSGAAPQDDVALAGDVHRYDPFSETLVPVTREEIKPNHLYLHYNAALGRRVWSLATEAKGFRYAMGEGSVQPAQRLDIRRTREQRERMLEEEAPRLARALRTFGTVAYIELGADNQWTLVTRTTITKIYDLETRRRWEWHGTQRLAVVHSYGDLWAVQNGKYVPAPSYHFASGPPCCAN